MTKTELINLLIGLLDSTPSIDEDIEDVFEKRERISPKLVAENGGEWYREIEQEAIVSLREAGWSFAEIGELLNRSPKAMKEKFYKLRQDTE